MGEVVSFDAFRKRKAEVAAASEVHPHDFFASTIRRILKIVTESLIANREMSAPFTDMIDVDACVTGKQAGISINLRYNGQCYSVASVRLYMDLEPRIVNSPDPAVQNLAAMLDECNMPIPQVFSPTLIIARVLSELGLAKNQVNLINYDCIYQIQMEQGGNLAGHEFVSTLIIRVDSIHEIERVMRNAGVIK